MASNTTRKPNKSKKRTVAKPDPFEIAKLELELEHIRHCNHLAAVQGAAELMKEYKLAQISWYDNGTLANVSTFENGSSSKQLGFIIEGGEDEGNPNDEDFDGEDGEGGIGFSRKLQ